MMWAPNQLLTQSTFFIFGKLTVTVPIPANSPSPNAIAFNPTKLTVNEFTVPSEF